MKKILILDRDYSYRTIKSEKFEIICVALTKAKKKKMQDEGINVIACFEEEFDSLPVASYPDNYLIYSFDSDRFLCRYDHEKRREILGKEISFWSRILDKYTPSLIVNEVVTIEFMEVMVIEARKRNIPYKTWAIVPFPHQDFWINTPFSNRQGPEFWDNVQYSLDDFSKAEEYMKAIHDKNMKPFYICFKQPSKIKYAVTSLVNYLKCLKGHFNYKMTNSFYYEDYSQIAKTELDNGFAYAFRKYDKIEFNNNVEYFYYPLHVEPEATISYFGDCFDDQTMIIARIAHSLKLNQKLIVKEHPQQRGPLLTKRYQELKKKFSNLIFIDGSVSGYDIFKHTKCLVTLNGTAGFEALVCGIPVIMFGQAFYRDCPGVTICENFRDLKQIIRNDAYVIPNREQVKIFVAKIYSLLTNTFPHVDSQFSRQEDNDEIKAQLESFLE